MKRFVFSLFTFLFLWAVALPQSLNFYGSVFTTDDSNNEIPLEGASVYLFFKAETDSMFTMLDSTISDVNGNYEFSTEFQPGMYEIDIFAYSCDDFFAWGPIEITESGDYNVDPAYLCINESPQNDSLADYFPYFTWFYDTSDYHTIWFYPDFIYPEAYTDVWVDFGDGDYQPLTYNQGVNTWLPAVHTYANDDVYTAVFTAYTETDTFAFMQDVYVYPFEPPIDECLADFVYTYDSTDFHTVYFFNFSYPINENVSFTWDFGDGETSEEINPAHVYADPGEYWVGLLMTDASSNCSDYVEFPVWVDDPDSLWFDDYQDECQALFFAEYYGDSLMVKDEGYLVYFYDMSWSGMNAEITHMLWTFGDGDTSAFPFPIHLYRDLGTYPVTLEIQTSDGCSSSFTMLITLDTDAVDTSYILFFPDFVEEGKGMTVKFHNLSEGDDDNLWVWDFGDSKKKVTTKGTDIVYHTYDQAGNYTVKLTNKNDGSWFAMDINVKNNGVQILRSYSSFASEESPTGAERNIEISNSILVYPNPAVDYVNVSAANAQDITVKVFSVDGKIVKQVQGQGSEMKVNVSDLNNGVYIFEVKAGENKAKFKIVK